MSKKYEENNFNIISIPPVHPEPRVCLHEGDNGGDDLDDGEQRGEVGVQSVHILGKCPELCHTSSITHICRPVIIIIIIIISS